LVLAATLLVLAQAAIGMAVNLYVMIPPRHPGAHPGDYLSGSFQSVNWAIVHGAAALAIHASLGIVVAAIAIGVASHAFRFGDRVIAGWSTIAAALVIGAGFNGASFLDFNHNTSSLIMSLLALGAVACYSIVLWLLGPA